MNKPAFPMVRQGTRLAGGRSSFFEGAPEAKGVAALDPDRSPPDRFEVQGRTLFIHCPAGLGRSKLTTAFFEKGAGTAVTMRNWNTVTALVALDA